MYDTIKSTNTMSGAKIQNVNLEPAENGVILSWTEKTEKKNPKNTYDNCDYAYKKQVFDGDDDATDKLESAFDKAQPEFKKLWKQQYDK